MVFVVVVVVVVLLIVVCFNSIIFANLFFFSSVVFDSGTGLVQAAGPRCETEVFEAVDYQIEATHEIFRYGWYIPSTYIAY